MSEIYRQVHIEEQGFNQDEKGKDKFLKRNLFYGVNSNLYSKEKVYIKHLLSFNYLYDSTGTLRRFRL